LIVEFKQLESIYLPLGENTIWDTAGLVSSINVLRHIPVDVSQILIKPYLSQSYIPSKLQDANKVPSTIKVTAETGSECAGSTRAHFAFLTSHSLTDSSKLPEAIKFDLGLKAQQKTKCECPLKTFSFCIPDIFHIRRVVSSDALTKYSESEDQAISDIPAEWP
jgi:hypothetical protein